MSESLLKKNSVCDLIMKICFSNFLKKKKIVKGSAKVYNGHH